MGGSLLWLSAGSCFRKMSNSFNFLAEVRGEALSCGFLLAVTLQSSLMDGFIVLAEVRGAAALLLASPFSRWKKTENIIPFWQQLWERLSVVAVFWCAVLGPLWGLTKKGGGGGGGSRS